MEQEWHDTSAATTTARSANMDMIPPEVLEEIEEEETVASSSQSHSQPIDHLSPSAAKAYRYVVGLKEREDIAKAAYKTWFRIKVENKEIKDRWWALYYKKLLPKFQLRDNHLGRQINAWIQEDLRALRKQAHESLAAEQQHLTGEDGTSKIELLPMEQEPEPPVKKRKANSSKEGTVPAYLNVELVHPSPDLVKLTPEMAMQMHIVEGSPEYYALKLREHCVDGNIDWDDYQLEEDVQWFKGNRADIMEKIPTLSGRNKNLGVLRPSNTQGQPPTTPSTAKKQIKANKINPLRLDNCDWINADVFHMDNSVIVKIDIPGMIPNQDFVVQCDDNNHLLLKGERRNDAEGMMSVLHQGRQYGKFELELVLPPEAVTAGSEQSLQNGVLTIKFPLKEKEATWRVLSVNHIRDEE